MLRQSWRQHPRYTSQRPGSNTPRGSGSTRDAKKRQAGGILVGVEAYRRQVVSAVAAYPQQVVWDVVVSQQLVV